MKQEGSRGGEREQACHVSIRVDRSNKRHFMINSSASCGASLPDRPGFYFHPGLARSCERWENFKYSEGENF